MVYAALTERRPRIPVARRRPGFRAYSSHAGMGERRTGSLTHRRWSGGIGSITRATRRPPARSAAQCCSWRRSAFWNFFVAGVFGFLINLPVVSDYEVGTLRTSNHGHAAFIGVYGKLALALLVCCTRYLARPEDWSEGRVRFSFWATNAKSPGTQPEKAQPQEHKARRLGDGPRNARNLIAAVGCAELEYYACERRIRGEAAEG